ncbi:hypothetical protein RJZ57_003925 [Blastomyces gilchristii]
MAAFSKARLFTDMKYFEQNEAHFVHLEGWFQNDKHLYIAMKYFQLNSYLLHACERIHSPRPKASDLGISKRVPGDSAALYISFDGSFMARPDSDAGQYTKAVDIDQIDEEFTPTRNHTFSKVSDPTGQQDGKVDEDLMEQLEFIARVEPETAQVSRTRAAQNQTGRNNSANISRSGRKYPSTHLRSPSSIRGQADSVSDEEFDVIPYTQEIFSGHLEDVPLLDDNSRIPDLTKEEPQLQGSEHSKTDHGSVQTNNAGSNKLFRYPPLDRQPHSPDHSPETHFRYPFKDIRQDRGASFAARRSNEGPRDNVFQRNKVRGTNPRSKQSGQFRASEERRPTLEHSTVKIIQENEHIAITGVPMGNFDIPRSLSIIVTTGIWNFRKYYREKMSLLRGRYQPYLASGNRTMVMPSQSTALDEERPCGTLAGFGDDSRRYNSLLQGNKVDSSNVNTGGGIHSGAECRNPQRQFTLKSSPA